MINLFRDYKELKIFKRWNINSVDKMNKCGKKIKII